MTQDSDGQRESDEEVREVIRLMSPEVERLLGGHQLLTGPASVQLMVQVEEALSPQEAVEFMIHRIVHGGFDIFTFAVTDMLTGDEYFVRGGELLTLAEVQGELKNDEESNGDERPA